MQLEPLSFFFEKLSFQKMYRGWHFIFVGSHLFSEYFLATITLSQILHSICRIAEVLLTLQQVGNVNYTGWALQVPCSTDRQLINQLQSQASDMENELSMWKKDVEMQRENFYELNYYTTLQLLTLRKELGRLKNPSKDGAIPPEILALLQSISVQVTPSHIIDAVNEVVLEAKVEPEPELTPGPPEEKDGVESSLTGHIIISKDTQEPSTKQMPMFTENDLSEEQKGIITTVCSRIDCSRKLVFEAFEVLGKGLHRIDYDKWCVQNLDRDDKEVSSDEDSSDSESDGESTDDAPSNDEDEFNYGPGS